MMGCKSTMVLCLTAILVGAGFAIGQAPPPPEDGQRQGETDRGDRGERGQQGDRGPRGDRGDRGATADRDGRGDRGDRGRGGGRWGSPSRGLLGGPARRITRTLFRPDYLTRDLAIIVEALSLDGEQADVVDMLLEDYDASFRMAVEETTQAMTDLGENSGADELEQDRVETLRGEMQSMRAEMREAPCSTSTVK